MTWPEPPPAALRLAIDTGALAANWRALDRLSGVAEAGAAIKADAYGLGVAAVLPALLKAGARRFWVAHWGEVAPALAWAEPAMLAVLHGVTTPAEAAFARASGVRPVISSLAQARLWLEGGGGPCQLMIDTGINRLGLGPQDAGDPALAGLTPELVLSHLACADEPDSAHNARQLAAFHAVLARFPGIPASLANSAGIALGPAYHFRCTRPGLALYGGVPCDALAGAIAPVVTPEAMVLQVRELGAGNPVGYNATFVAPAAMRIATVALGYADGLLRQWGGRCALAHRGARLPVLGRISMDMVVVDAGAAPALAEGDFVQLPYGLAMAAAASGLSQYELLTVLGRRFARTAPAA